MARITSGIKFIGSLDNLTAYRVRGSDEIILRRKGGPAREQVLNGKNFVNTRRNIAEFSARSGVAKHIMHALMPLRALADYNIAGPLNALLKPIQILDSISAWGERSVELSKHKSLLQGFSLNRKYLLDAALRMAPAIGLSRETHLARVALAAMIPGINFIPDPRHPYYSIEITLGIVPDMVFQPAVNRYEATIPDDQFGKSVSTPWLPITHAATGHVLTLEYPHVSAGNAYTLVLGLGLRYGTVTADGTIQQVKHAGSAKVIAVA